MCADFVTFTEIILNGKLEFEVYFSVKLDATTRPTTKNIYMLE